MAEDIEELLSWAQECGWTVIPDNDGYRHLYTPDGKWVARYPKTPSRPGRRYLDVRTAAKQNGLIWPKPSKKELRSMRRKAQEEE